MERVESALKKRSWKTHQNGINRAAMLQQGNVKVWSATSSVNGYSHLKEEWGMVRPLYFKEFLIQCPFFLSFARNTTRTSTSKE